MFVRVVLILTAVLVLGACTDASQPEGTPTDAPTQTSEPSPPASEEDSAAGLDQAALQRVTEAAANTAEAGTARFDLTIKTEDTGAGDGRQPVMVVGEEDFEAQQRNLTFVGPEGDLEVVVDDTDVYVQVPATEDEDWARIELDALMQDDVGFGGVGGLPFQSPQDNLAVLEDAVTAAAQGEEGDVRGDPSTRYDLTVDLEAAAQEGADDTRGALSAAAEQSGITELDMQVWVNGDDMVNRISYSLDLAQADTGEVASELETEGVDAEVSEPSGRVIVNVEYYDFGAEVTIDIPDDADVVDIDEDEILDSFNQ